MKYLVKYVMIPAYKIFVMIPLFLLVGLMVTLGYFFWNLSFKGCPTFDPNFWFGVQVSTYDLREYRYNSFKDFIFDQRTYLDDNET